MTTMANIVLAEGDKQEYTRCQALIADCYRRMSTNRSPDYRAKMQARAAATLERMTRLLEGGLMGEL